MTDKIKGQRKRHPKVDDLSVTAIAACPGWVFAIPDGHDDPIAVERSAWDALREAKPAIHLGYLPLSTGMAEELLRFPPGHHIIGADFDAGSMAIRLTVAGHGIPEPAGAAPEPIALMGNSESFDQKRWFMRRPHADLR